MKDKKWWIFIGIVIVIIVVLLIVKNNMKDNNVSSEEENNSTEDVITIITPNNDKDKNEFVNVEDGGVRVNKSDKLSGTKKIEGLEISNIRLTEKDNLTQILADVKNTTNKDKEGFFIRITMLDKDEEILVILGGYIPAIKANETATLNTNSTGDFANAYDFKVERMEVQE